MGVWDIVETAPVEITPIGGLKVLKAPSVATATLNTFTPQVEQGPHLGTERDFLVMHYFNGYCCPAHLAMC